MSRLRNSADNARMEGLFGRMKNKMFYHRQWETPDELITSIYEYIQFRNTRKIITKHQATIPEIEQQLTHH